MSSYITKEYLKQYHEHVKDLPREAKYPELVKYEYDANGKIKLDGNNNPITIKDGSTLIEAINNRLSQDAAEPWNASHHPFSENIK